MEDPMVQVLDRLKPRAGQLKAYEVLNAIASVSRDAETLALSERLVKQPAILELLAPKQRREFQELTHYWLNGLRRTKQYAFDCPLAKLVVALDDAWRQDGRSWYVTVVDFAGANAFAEDNWGFFRLYAVVHGDVTNASPISVVVRRFERLSDPTRRLASGRYMPIKSVGGLYISGSTVTLLSAEEMRAAHSVDAATGRPLHPESQVRFVDMAELSPSFAKAVSAGR